MIRPKVVKQGRQFNENARRYVFYPMSNLDFAGSQFTSPLWSPKIERGRFTLLESLEYTTQVTNEGEHLAGSNGVVLGTRMMGTDAQVKFLMGSSEGTGWLEKGMTHFESLVDVDPNTAIEIEAMLLPSNEAGEIVVPRNLIDFQRHLDSLVIPADHKLAAVASQTLAEMRDGVARAINFCRSYTAELEQELNQGRNGGLGIKSLSATMRYYFQQIDAPLPEDRAGANAGAELSKALQPVFERLGVQTTPVNAVADSVERAEMEKKMAAMEATIREQEEAIEALTAPTEETNASE